MLNDLRDTFGFRIPEIFPVGTTPQGNAVIAAMPTTPDADRQKLIQALVKGLIDDGIWTKLDTLYLTAAHAQDSSLLNWINPGTYDCTVVNLLAANFTIDRGWTGNGVNGYLNTNYNPNTDGINYALNDASLGIYIRTNVSEDKRDIGASDGIPNVTEIVTGWTDGNAYYWINNNILSLIANADSRGFYITSRLNANDQDLYRNKIKISDDNDASVGIPSVDLYIIALNNNGVANDFTTKQYSAAFTSSGMTQTNVNNFTDRIETFMDAIGAGVI